MAIIDNIEIIHICFAIKDCLIDKDNIVVLYRFTNTPNYINRDVYNIHSLRREVEDVTDIAHGHLARLWRFILQEFEKMRAGINPVVIEGRT